MEREDRLLLQSPCERSILRACMVCAHLPITEDTCSLTDRWLLTVTPNILIEDTRGIPSNGFRNCTWRRRVLSTNTISTDFFKIKVELVSRSPSADTVYFVGSRVDVAGTDNKTSVVSVFTKSVTRSYRSEVTSTDDVCL